MLAGCIFTRPQQEIALSPKHFVAVVRKKCKPINESPNLAEPLGLSKWTALLRKLVNKESGLVIKFPA